ncbi:hypothetical protein D4M86_18745, partial [Escherichia coli]|uniref:hypothetical protein n=1 Tax=Escherichia coli TaxID=562 RepID=UPI0013B5D7EA
PSISDGRLSYQFSSDGYIRRSVYAYNHSPLAKPNKTVFKYQKTLVQDRTSCMIEITFCELTDILEKGIKGINNGEIE